MTFGLLQKIIEYHHIPSDVHLTSDSGWECDATEMDGIYYNQSKNEIVFTQHIYECDGYFDREGWCRIYGEIDERWIQ